jgi:hypothetical protein
MNNLQKTTDDNTNNNNTDNTNGNINDTKNDDIKYYTYTKQYYSKKQKKLLSYSYTVKHNYYKKVKIDKRRKTYKKADVYKAVKDIPNDKIKDVLDFIKSLKNDS